MSILRKHGDGKGASGNRSSANAPGASGGAAAAQDQKKGRIALPPNMEPTYYIGGYNGTGMIDTILSSGLGWRRTKDKLDETYKFKWCELKSAINYHSFKEGEQIVNHIPNCQLLTNKLGLLNTLQEYDRVCATVKRRVPKLDFIPETFRLSEHKHREAFLQQYQEGEMWICKPTGRNQGKGIYLVRNIDEVKKILQVHDSWNEQCAQRGKPKQSLNRIIQRYITNPLLLNGKKFDIRAYMLIACMTPYLVLYHKGYVRLSIHDYDTGCENIIAHLTNQFIQRKDPTYKEVKEETSWSMDKFNDYINDNVATQKGLEANWVYHTFTNRIKQIMLYCFTSVKHKLHCKTGYFDLYGFDFMIDEDMKTWLIEVNVNPCLATNCKALADVVPRVVRETIYISVECFEKARRSKPLFPLKALENFEIIFSDTPRLGYANPPRSTTAQQLVPSGDTRGRIPSLSPHRQTSTKEVGSAQQKGHESELKVVSAKPHQSTSTTKETTSNKKGTSTANQEDENHDVSNSTKSTPEKADGNHASDDSDCKKVSAEKLGENHAAGDGNSKKISTAKPAESESDSRKASPEKSAENGMSNETASKRASLAKSAEYHTSDGDTEKESPAKSAENISSDESDSKKISSTNHASDSSESKTLLPTKPAENYASDDSASKKVSPTKSAENDGWNNGDSKKVRGVESHMNKQLLPSTSEPNSQSLPSDATKQPHSARRSSHRLPSLPTPAPPLVSGIERLAKSPYAEPVRLKMTHSSLGEHKKTKGARLDGKQSRGS